jgi:hypothetical protein
MSLCDNCFTKTTMRLMRNHSDTRLKDRVRCVLAAASLSACLLAAASLSSRTVRLLTPLADLLQRGLGMF